MPVGAEVQILGLVLLELVEDVNGNNGAVHITEDLIQASALVYIAGVFCSDLVGKYDTHSGGDHQRVNIGLTLQGIGNGADKACIVLSSGITVGIVFKGHIADDHTVVVALPAGLVADLGGGTVQHTGGVGGICGFRCRLGSRLRRGFRRGLGSRLRCALGRSCRGVFNGRVLCQLFCTLCITADAQDDAGVAVPDQSIVDLGNFFGVIAPELIPHLVNVGLHSGHSSIQVRLLCQSDPGQFVGITGITGIHGDNSAFRQFGVGKACAFAAVLQGRFECSIVQKCGEDFFSRCLGGIRFAALAAGCQRKQQTQGKQQGGENG